MGHEGSRVVNFTRKAVRDVVNLPAVVINDHRPREAPSPPATVSGPLIENITTSYDRHDIVSTDSELNQNLTPYGFSSAMISSVKMALISKKVTFQKFSFELTLGNGSLVVLGGYAKNNGDSKLQVRFIKSTARGTLRHRDTYVAHEKWFNKVTGTKEFDRYERVLLPFTAGQIAEISQKLSLEIQSKIAPMIQALQTESGYTLGIIEGKYWKCSVCNTEVKKGLSCSCGKEEQYVNDS